MSRKALKNVSTGRRGFLKWFVGGAWVAASLLVVPISEIGRLIAPGGLPKIPIKPFKRSDLDKPCQWSG